MYTSSAKSSAFIKIVATFIAVCCIFSTSNGAEIPDDISTIDLDRNLRSAVSHYLRGGRASATSHYLRGRRSDGLVNTSGFNHFLRGGRAGVNHFLRGRKAGVNHFLRGRKSTVNHFLRGKKSLPVDDGQMDSTMEYEEPSDIQAIDILY